MVNRLRDSSHQARGPIERNRVALEQGREGRPSRDQVHDQEVAAIIHLANAVYANDVGMAQPGQSPRLGEESPYSRWRVERLTLNQLQRHALVQALLKRFVNLAHAAGAEQAHQW